MSQELGNEKSKISQEMSVGELCENYPDTKAFSFMLNNNPQMYFRVADPIFNPARNSNIRAKVKCIAVSTRNNKIFETMLLFKKTDTIQVITAGEFAHKIFEYLKQNPSLTENYALYGFKERSQEISGISE